MPKLPSNSLARHKNNKLLLEAAIKGDEDEVLHLIDNGANVNVKGNYGSSPMHPEDNHGYSPLHYASVNGHSNMVKLLITNGADVHAKGSDGYSPLHCASENGHVEVIKLLVSNGADINAKDRRDETPLHHAIYEGNVDVVKLKLLISKGADVYAKRYDGRTPLDVAKIYGKESVINLLRSSKATLNVIQSDHKESFGKLQNVHNSTQWLGSNNGTVQQNIEGENSTTGFSLSTNFISSNDIIDNIPQQSAANNINTSVIGKGDNLGMVGQLQLTYEDMLFLKMGRELVKDAAAITTISEKERSAIKTLTTNLGDFERSLESVRELPSSLKDKGHEVSTYFFFFTSAFERTYVAAQALNTGAVTAKLNMNMAGLLVGGASWVAEKSNLPFVGCISIFSEILKHQQITKKANMFKVFEDFFRGNSRDQYLITYRKLAEQICLQLSRDPSSFTEFGLDAMCNLKEQIKKIVKPIRKNLQKVHLDIIEELSIVEEKAMADLASITKDVLRLHQRNYDKYEIIRASNEVDKASYFIEHLFGFESSPDQISPSCGSTQVIMHQASASASASQASTKDAALTELEHLIHKIQALEGQNRKLQKHADANANMPLKLQQMETQVRKLAAKAKSEKDLIFARGCQAQAQVNPNRRKEETKGLAQRIEQIENGLFRVQAQQEIVQIEQEKQSGELERVMLEQFIRNRVLNVHEAFEFTDTLLTLACGRDGKHMNIEVSEDGKFELNGKEYCIGKVRKGSLISKNKTLWKDKVDIKLEDEYRGVKSIMYWFDRADLRPLYERNKRRAIRKMFSDELEEKSASEMAQPFQGKNERVNRGKLFHALDPVSSPAH